MASLSKGNSKGFVHLKAFSKTRHDKNTKHWCKTAAPLRLSRGKKCVGKSLSEAHTTTEVNRRTLRKGCQNFRFLNFKIEWMRHLSDQVFNHLFVMFVWMDTFSDKRKRGYAAIRNFFTSWTIMVIPPSRSRSTSQPWLTLGTENTFLHVNRGQPWEQIKHSYLLDFQFYHHIKDQS